jgi:beta-phosphoglucomutase-like phosphatase (HAD superfamily)
MDGTVLDSEGLFDKAQIKLLNGYGISVDATELSEFKGMSYKDFYPQFMNKFQITGDVNSIRSKLRAYLHRIMEGNLRYINGFEDFYSIFIRGTSIKVGLVTNTTRLTYQKIETCINIGDYFQFSITATESKEPKPSPVPYIQAMDDLSLDLNQTLIIEDSKTGLVSALGSGARVIGITTSLSKNKIKDIDSSIYVVGSYAEIGEYLQNW